MKTNTTVLIFATITIAITGYFLLSNSGSSEEKKVQYSSMIQKPKEKAFTDLKCLANIDKSKNIKASIIQEESGISPKGVKYRDVFVAKKETISGMPISYSMQRIVYTNGVCESILTRQMDIGSEDESISSMYGKERGIKIQYIWSKWQYDNIPGWKEYKQKELKSSKTFLSEEEIPALKKLGFSVPKNRKK
jgi:hypothetical protein